MKEETQSKSSEGRVEDPKQNRKRMRGHRARRKAHG